MRVLVATLPERGHYHPLLGPAAELSRRGHEVVWTCAFDIEAELRAAGVSSIALHSSAARPPDDVRGKELAEILVDPARLAAWIERLLIEAPRKSIEPMRAVIRDVRPDVVAIDTMAYDAAIAATVESVPWVGWSTSLNPIVDEEALDSTLIRTLRALDDDRMELFLDHGIAALFRVSDVLSPRGTAVFATEALVGPARDPNVRLVGPSLGGVRGGARIDTSFADDRPLVYASFGSQAWYQPARFAKLVAACDRIGFALVAATGELELGAYEHVRTAPYVDQHDALARASIFVTHGGANSIMEACAFGVPMLVAPICNDQPHGAHYVARAGAGLAIDLDGATPDALDAALVRALGMRPRADEIRASYASRDGSIGATELVESARPR